MKISEIDLILPTDVATRPKRTHHDYLFAAIPNAEGAKRYGRDAHMAATIDGRDGFREAQYRFLEACRSRLRYDAPDEVRHTFDIAWVEEFTFSDDFTTDGNGPWNTTTTTTTGA